MEDDATQHGQPVNTPEAIAERLRKIEEEAAALRAAMAAAQGSEPPSTEEVAPEEEPEPDAPVTYDQVTLDKVDKLLQRYRLESARGNREIGTQYLKEAQALAPKASVVLEVLGDDAADRRQVKDAIEFYRRAKEADTKNASADKKHADLVFRTQAVSASIGMTEFENVASSRSATMLSIFVPGLGHMVTGQVAKGAGYTLVWVGAIIWFVLTPGGIQGIVAMVSNRSEPKLNMVVFIPMFLGLVTWLAAMIDMNTRSKLIVPGVPLKSTTSSTMSFCVDPNATTS